MIGGILLSLQVLRSWNDILYSGSESTSTSAISLFDSISFASLTSAMDGSMKYLMLIALEIVIFHFSRRTLMIVTGEIYDTSFKRFIEAEKRMIKVALFSYIAELVFIKLTNVALSILGMTIISAPAGFIITSFYLGFAIVDNYNEVYKMTIKQSHRYTWHFAPVALIVGAMLNIAIQVPVLGFIIGSVVCAVIGTLAKHHLSPGLSDMAWVYVEKEKKPRSKRKKRGAS